ncbi:MAG: hypothetical protein ACTSU5_02240 [Promethearchaeota archaeon]
MSDEKGRTEGELTQLRGRLAELVQVSSTLEALERETSGDRQRAAVHELLGTGIFHARGITQYSVAKLAGRISTTASEYLGQITGGRYTSLSLEPAEQGRSYGFQVLVYDPEARGGERRPVATFSGGEQTQINAALRFAISKVVSEMSFHGLRFLFVDEGDMGSLDEDAARLDFVGALQGLTSVYRQLVLITHFPSVAERFAGRYEVSIEGGNSRIQRRG